jgi:signal transduction histidine kinase
MPAQSPVFHLPWPRIEREHGGDIIAQSEVKKGATFSISLPALRQE